jgi:glucose/arabinose dehydrogenase
VSDFTPPAALIDTSPQAADPASVSPSLEPTSVVESVATVAAVAAAPAMTAAPARGAVVGLGGDLLSAPGSGSDGESPLAGSVAWAVLGVTRRELGSRTATARSTASTTISEEPLIAAAGRSAVAVAVAVAAVKAQPTTSVFFESNPQFSESAGTVLVPIRRTGDLTRTTTIEYGITPGTATAGLDYVAENGKIEMGAGVDRVFIPVKVIDDDLAEATETFVVSIINVDDQSTLLFPRTARIDILDDEQQAVDPISTPLTSKYAVRQQPVANDLNQPMGFEFAPWNPSLLYVAEKEGVVKVFDVETGEQRSTFVDISSQVNSNQDRGLLDISLHPDFGKPGQTGESGNNYLYAFYVADPTDSVGNPNPQAAPDGNGNRFAYVVRFTADATTNYTTAVPGSEVILLGGVGVPGKDGLQPRTLEDISGGGAVDSTSDLSQPESGIDPKTGRYVDNYVKVDSRSHAGGSLAFGPDGALYVGTGDGVSFDAVDPRASSVQQIDSLSGKILRIDPITGLGLKDNPFVEPGDDLATNSAKVYQSGLRNPFSIGFAQDGRLFMTNTGWFSWEEIETGGPGANFGWPYFEGGDGGVLQRTPGYQELPGDPTLDRASAAAFYEAVANGDIVITPAYRAFSHEEQGRAIVGISGPSYVGSRYPVEFENDLFFTDVNSGAVFAIDSLHPSDVRYLYSSADFTIGFSRGPDDYMYAVNLSGAITRLLIEPARSTQVQPIPPANTSLTPNGDASVSGDVVTLTTAGGTFDVGTAMSGQRIDVSKDFTLAFEIYLGADDGGADGAAVVFHNDPRGVAAIGGASGALGVGGLRKGLAIEFDTYANIPNNPAQPNADIAADHTSFIGTDRAFGTVAVALPNTENGAWRAPNVEDGAWHPVVVTWNAAAQTLSYTFDNQSAGTLTADIVSEFFGGSKFVYFGFGAATGGLSNTQSVRSVSTTATFESQAPVPVVTTPYGGLTPGGGASVSGDVFSLTAAGGRFDQVGTAMSSQRIDVSRNFTLAFEINLGANDFGADGAAVVFHNDPRGVAAVGGSGGALGATGIRNGLAIEFDAYANVFNNPQPNADIVADHTSFVGTDSAFGTTAVGLPNIENGGWHSVVVTWNAAAKTLSYTLDNQPAGTLNSDIATQFFGGSQYAYFGFTAATGGLSNTQSVRNVSTSATFESQAPVRVVTTPYGGLTPGGGASLSGDVVALTAAGGGFDQVGTAMSSQRIDVSRDFTLAFEIKLGADDFGADGAAVVLHNDARGVAAIGSAGGGLGVDGIANGVAIEFDTYANVFNNPQPNADIAADHTSFVGTDSAFGTTAVGLPNIENGGWHSVVVTWNAAAKTLSYTFDNQPAGTLNSDIATQFFGGSQYAYFGFTAATGGLSNTQSVRNVSTNATFEPYRGLIAGGRASVSGDVVALTAAGGGVDQVGTAMSSQRIDVSRDFTVAFEMYLGADDFGADGAALVFHNDPRGAGAIGSTGGGLGVGGIADGLAIEFDTYANIPDNPGQPNADIVADHTSFLDTNGTFGTAAVALPNVENGAWHAVAVFWNAAARTLSYTVDNRSAGSLTADLVSEFFGGSQFVHFGFGAATGGLSNTQSVRNVSTSATFESPAPVSVVTTPYAGLTPGGGATVSGGVVSLTAAGGGFDQVGTAMSAGRIDVSRDFTVAFEMYLGADDFGADGAALVFHNDPRGAGAIGRAGGGLGVGGIADGLAIEFDTYANVFNNPQPNADIVADHTSFIGTDRAFGTVAVALPNIENGTWHAVVVSWNATAQTLSYTVDNRSAGSLTADLVSEFFGGSQFVHFGFGAATGGLSNTQSVRNVSTNATFESQAELSA